MGEIATNPMQLSLHRIPNNPTKPEMSGCRQDVDVIEFPDNSNTTTIHARTRPQTTRYSTIVPASKIDIVDCWVEHMCRSTVCLWVSSWYQRHRLVPRSTRQEHSP